MFVFWHASRRQTIVSSHSKAVGHVAATVGVPRAHVDLDRGCFNGVAVGHLLFFDAVVIWYAKSAEVTIDPDMGGCLKDASRYRSTMQIVALVVDR